VVVLAVAFGNHTARAMQPLASRGTPTILLVDDEENPRSSDEAAPPSARRQQNSTCGVRAHFPI